MPLAGWNHAPASPPPLARVPSDRRHAQALTPGREDEVLRALQLAWFTTPLAAQRGRRHRPGARAGRTSSTYDAVVAAIEDPEWTLDGLRGRQESRPAAPRAARPTSRARRARPTARSGCCRALARLPQRGRACVSRPAAFRRSRHTTFMMAPTSTPTLERPGAAPEEAIDAAAQPSPTGSSLPRGRRHPHPRNNQLPDRDAAERDADRARRGRRCAPRSARRRRALAARPSRSRQRRTGAARRARRITIAIRRWRGESGRSARRQTRATGAGSLQRSMSIRSPSRRQAARAARRRHRRRRRRRDRPGARTRGALAIEVAGPEWLRGAARFATSRASCPTARASRSSRS